MKGRARKQPRTPRDGSMSTCSFRALSPPETAGRGRKLPASAEAAGAGKSRALRRESNTGRRGLQVTPAPAIMQIQRSTYIRRQRALYSNFSGIKSHMGTLRLSQLDDNLKTLAVPRRDQVSGGA